MNQAQPPMGVNDHLVYFYEHQVVVTFHSELSPDALKRSIRRDWHSTYVQLLNDGLKNAQDATTRQLTLKPFAESDIPRPQRKMRHDLTDLPGVYVFQTPTGTGTKGTIVAFFHIVSSMPSTQLTGGADGMGNRGATDTTSQAIKLINSLDLTAVASLHHTHISAIAAGPHWFTSGVVVTDDTTHGCPVIPPLPILESPPSGLWQITPQLSDDSINDSTGEGVTVFVLDTLPTFDQIAGAASAAGNSNTLLQAMAMGMADGEAWEAVDPPAINIHYLENLPDPANTPVTGKDSNGDLVGFPMVDHGIFVAGIVRDLAPGADIECVRVLNDFGVGNTATLIGVLYHIQNRMLEGDLQDTPVVINLSLVIMPPTDNLSQIGLDVGADATAVNQLHDELLTPIQSLAALGALFVASVGNDSDLRDTKMNPTHGHFVSRYPAHFVYDKGVDAVTAAAIIPVGAVNQSGEAASYSNYPGPHGVATYAGEIPLFKRKSPTPDDPNDATVTPPVDALRGIYTSAGYPFSYRPDNTLPPVSYPKYPAPNANAWAYWMGTSFATPIISGLVARVLETQPPSGDSVRQTIISAATRQALWTNIQPYSQGMEVSNESASVPVIMAAQE